MFHFFSMDAKSFSYEFRPDILFGGNHMYIYNFACAKYMQPYSKLYTCLMHAHFGPPLHSCIQTQFFFSVTHFCWFPNFHLFAEKINQPPNTYTYIDERSEETMILLVQINNSSHKWALNTVCHDSMTHKLMCDICTVIVCGEKAWANTNFTYIEAWLCKSFI